MYTVLFYFYEMSRTGSSIDTGGTLVIARGWEGWQVEERSLGIIKLFYNKTVAMDAQL